MKLTKADIQGFRCLEEVPITFDELTILLGCNSTGKSSLLRALKFFFEGDALEADDVFGRTGEGRVVVRLTFDSLTQADRKAFGKYALGDQMVLTCAWEGGEIKRTGRGLVFREFDSIRALSGRERTTAYKALREAKPELGLSVATKIDDVDAAMLTWEMEHPDQCDQCDQDAGQLFGYKSVGQSVISSRFKFVFVPGVRDVADETVERKGSILERLLSAIAEQRAAANEKLADFEQATGRSTRLLLRSLTDRLSKDLRSDSKITYGVMSRMQRLSLRLQAHLSKSVLRSLHFVEAKHKISAISGAKATASSGRSSLPRLSISPRRLRTSRLAVASARLCSS